MGEGPVWVDFVEKPLTWSSAVDYGSSRSGRLGRMEESFDFAACWVPGRVLKTSFPRMVVHCERLYRVSSSAQDGQDKVGVERLDRVITAHLAHMSPGRRNS